MSDTNTMTAMRGHVSALAFVAKGGASFDALLTHYATAKEAETMGPVTVVAFVENLSEEEQALIPVPGSQEGKTGNKPYDRFTAEIRDGATVKKIPGSWVTDAVSNTSGWIAESLEIEWCDKPGEGMPEHIANMGTGQRQEYKVKLNNRKKYRRTCFSNGLKLWHHASEIASLGAEIKNPETGEVIAPVSFTVRMPIRQEKDGNNQPVWVAYGSLIRLEDKLNVDKDVVMTVNEFLAIDTSKLKAGERVTVKALELTKARKPKTKGGTKSTGFTVPMPKNVENVLLMFNTLATALDVNTDEGKKLSTALIAQCTSGTDKGKDALITTGDFFVGADDTIWSVINALYSAAKIETAKARNVAAATTKAA